MKRIFAGISLVLVIALAAFSLSGCDQSSAQAKMPPPEPKRVKVGVEEVIPESIRDVLVLPGSTKPYMDVTLAADQGGKVEWMGPREGDPVKKGDLLVKIDVSALKAQLDNAKAAYSLSAGQYNRRKRLYNRKIISREELDQVRTDMSVKMGAVRQAQVAHDQGFIYAPHDGVINTRYVDPGEFVGRGEPVVNLVNVSKVEVEVSVPELDVKYMKTGATVSLKVDALPEHTFMGAIDFISMKADAMTKTFRIKVLVDNNEGLIRPGMISRVALLKREVNDALVAPLFSLVDKGGERLLYVVKDDVVQARVVKTGILDGHQVQIVSGLEAGDQLIVVGNKDVEEGMKVEVQ